MSVELLNWDAQPRFQQELPHLPIVDARQGGRYRLTARQHQASLGLLDANSAQPLSTTLWGFQAQRLGKGRSSVATSSQVAGTPPVLLTRSGSPIKVQWANALPTDLAGDHLLGVDPTLSESSHHNKAENQGLIPMVVHLHGGHNAWTSDGYPDNWITQDNRVKGSRLQPKFYSYRQDQSAATLWFHDHTMGRTRLNTYAGLNGAYVIEDRNSQHLVGDGVLPPTLGNSDTLLMIQDRAFTSEGALYYPGSRPDDPIPGTYDATTGQWQTVADELPEDYTLRGGQYPTAMPEFFGDFVMVNGVYAPFAKVEQSDAVYRLVNSSDSRFYVLQLDNPYVKATLLASDGGLLSQARVVFDGDGVQQTSERLVLAPGERLQVMLDFSAVAAGETVQLLNRGPAFEPFKGFAADGSLNTGEAGGSAVDPGTNASSTSSSILAFHVVNEVPVSKEFHSNLTDDLILNRDVQLKGPAEATRTRRIALYEGEDALGRIHPLLGTAEDVLSIDGEPVKAGPVPWSAPTTEALRVGDTEIWTVFNNTEDAHPLHLHPLQFQVLGRYEQSATDLDGDGYLNDLGASLALYPEDAGNQDTVWIAPGQAIQLIGSWDLAGSYVYHCHILSHEDHTMMRPLDVFNPVVGTARPDRLIGTDDADEIQGLQSDDIVLAGLGDDHFLATRDDGDDRYDGGHGLDHYDCSRINTAVVIDLQSTADGRGRATGTQIGIDVLQSIENVVGGSAADRITGADTANHLVGGAGDDHLRGLAGLDRLTGGTGDDSLSGGEDADTFVFLKEPGQAQFRLGRDVITDFQAAGDDHDVLLLDSRMFADFATMMAAGAITQVGSSVVIDYNSGNRISLLGASLQDLVGNAAECFAFV